MIFFKTERSSIKQGKTRKNIRKYVRPLTMAVAVILMAATFVFCISASDNEDNSTLGDTGDRLMWHDIKYTIVTGASKDSPGTVELIDAHTAAGSVVNIPEKIMDSIGREYFVTRIAEAAFEGSSVRSVIIPDTVTAICKYAFFGAPLLETVTVPSSVTYIGEYAFGLTSLSVLALPLHLLEKGAIEINGVTDNTMIVCYEGVPSMTAAMGDRNIELAIPQSYDVSEISVTAYHNSSNVIYQGKELSFPHGNYNQYYQVKVTLDDGTGDGTGYGREDGVGAIWGTGDGNGGDGTGDGTGGVIGGTGTEIGEGISMESVTSINKNGAATVLMLIVLAELVLIGVGLMWKKASRR
jgi:hypothetical protein